MKLWLLLIALVMPVAAYAQNTDEDLQVVIDEIRRLQAENEALLAYRDCAYRDLVYRPDDAGADEMGCVEFTIGGGAPAAAAVPSQPTAPVTPTLGDPARGPSADDEAAAKPLPRARSIPLSEMPRVSGDMPAVQAPQIPLKAPEARQQGGITLPASAPQLPTCEAGQVLSTDAEGTPICVALMQNMPANEEQELPGNVCQAQSVFVQTDYNNTRFHFRVPNIRDGETRDVARKTFVAGFTCRNGRLSISWITRKECGGTSLWKSCEEGRPAAHQLTYECPGIDDRCYAKQANGRMNPHLYMRAHIVRQR